MNDATRTKRPRVALVGRPNVGKSTLFNRMVGRREAIVHDRPGVTRDRIERDTAILRTPVTLIDTGGMIPEDADELTQVVTEQALAAVQVADVVVFVIDGRVGVTPLDENIATILRTADRPVVIAVNKLDTDKHENLVADAWRLGLGDPVALSAEHALGIDRLNDAILEHLPDADVDAGAVDDDVHAFPDPNEELLIALVGRPNVGKSSIINCLAGTDRVSVSPVPGTTRDAIDVAIKREGRQYRLVDTAGVRRRSKVAAWDESIGIMLTRRRVKRAHVAIVVIDAKQGLTSQDVGLAGEVDRAGRPIVFALNKWDLVEDPEKMLEDFDNARKSRIAFARYAPRLTVSALTGQRVFKLLDVASSVVEAASQTLPTSALNRFLQSTVGDYLSGGGGRVKTFYMTQVGVLPPRFVIFARDAGTLGEPFRRFIENRLRDAFDLGPTPVSVEFRKPPRRGPEGEAD